MRNLYLLPNLKILFSNPNPRFSPNPNSISRSLRQGSLVFFACRALPTRTMSARSMPPRPPPCFRASIDFGIQSLKRRLFRRRYFPRPDGAVLSLLGANVTVFILWIFADPTFMRKNFMISVDNFMSGHLHTLLTSAFSHSNPSHLLRNMMGLCIFGTNIGRLFGSQFLLKLYIAGALGGSTFFLLHDALIAPFSKGMQGLDYSGISGLGASAAVNAIILLKVFLFPKNIIYLNFIIPVPAVLVGALKIGTDLWSVKQGEQEISGSAHLGGALVAALVWARVKKRWI